MPEQPSEPVSPTDRVRLVVLFGGVSAEHDISCVTAASVIDALDRDRYDVVPVGITLDGVWHHDDTVMDAGTHAGSIPLDRLDPDGPVVNPMSIVAQPAGSPPTVVLPLLHGPHGEDGTVQGFLETAGLPYVGSGVLASAMCMDKTLAKTVIGAAGIPQCKAFNLTAGQGDPKQLAARAELIMEFGEIDYPVFVKPANLGSSVGISQAHDLRELVSALELAMTYDDRFVVEESVVGREIEIAVLGNSIGSVPPRASLPGEIEPGSSFYDYDEKYRSGSAQLLIPADLDDAEIAAVTELALEAFDTLRCDGLARVDFFYEADDRGFLLNEINTIPGFTPRSMYPKLWDASGLSYSDLLDELVRLALERHTRRSAFSTAP